MPSTKAKHINAAVSTGEWEIKRDVIRKKIEVV